MKSKTICFSSNLKNEINGWKLEKNAQCFVSWSKNNSTIEIQKNDELMWETTLFTFNENGIEEKEEVLFMADFKQSILKLTYNWMNDEKI